MTVTSKFTMVKTQTTKKSASAAVPSELLWTLMRQQRSVRYIAKQLQQRGYKVSKSTVQNRIAELKRQSCTAASMLKSRQKKLTNRDKRSITALIRFEKLRSKTAVFNELQKLGKDISYRTLRRTLATMPNIKFVRPKTKVLMTEDHKRRRLQWARQQLRSPPDWTKVVYIDEKQWKLHGPVSRGKVLYDTRDPPPSLALAGKQNDSVEVWGAFSLSQFLDLAEVSPHFNSDEYISVLAARFLPRRRAPIPVLLHDRHPAHRSKKTCEWLETLGIQVIKLPAKSPDLNPMEHVWAAVSRRVYSELKTYSSRTTLLAAVRAAWDEVRSNHSMRQNLVDSMTARLQAVVQSKGGPTKF